jgi:uroporphyrinogen decarboxylase
MTPQTLAGFRLPDVHRDGRMPIHLEMLRRTRAALGDTVCVVGRIAAPFSTQALVYGVDTLLLQMFEDAALVRDNLDFFVEHQIAFGRAQIQAGADTLWLGDCVAGSAFISPRHFAQFVREAASRVASALIAEGALVIYHTAETSLAHLALQVEMPVSAVNVGEGVSIADIRRRLGRCMCLMGNFDPLLLRDGTPAQVEAATERMIRDNLPGGGYVFNTGEGIMPTTPPENVENMIAAAKALAGS